MELNEVNGCSQRIMPTLHIELYLFIHISVCWSIFETLKQTFFRQILSQRLSQLNTTLNHHLLFTYLSPELAESNKGFISLNACSLRALMLLVNFVEIAF